MSRSIRMLTLAGVVSALLAVGPATAGADTIPPTADPPSLNFGSLPVGTQSLPQPVTLTETCTSVSCLTSILPDVFSPAISTTTGFAETTNCPEGPLTALLGLPQTCVINVSFVPGVVGQISGLLNTGPGGPSVALNGVGTPPPSSSGVKRRKCKKHKKHRSASASKKKQCKKRKRR